MRRQHQERGRQRVTRVADRDLLFLHGLEESALYFRRGSIDFVRQYQVGEDGAFLDREFTGSRIIDLGADDVGREQVGRELDAVKTELQPLGQRAHRQGLGQAGHALEQDVPAGQEPYQQPVDHGPLADDDLLQLAVEPVQAGSEVLHETTDRLHFIRHQGTAL